MDDISRELPPDSTGATPVSERQKGPEELQRFELGQLGESAEHAPQFGDRLAGMGASFLADRFLAVNTGTDNSSAAGGRFGDGDEPDAEPATLQNALPDDGEVSDAAVSAETVHVQGDVSDNDVAEDDVAELDLAVETEVEALPESESEADVGNDHVAVEVDEDLVDVDLDREPTDEDALAELSDEEEQDIDQDAAAAAVAAEAGTAELDNQEDLVDSELGEDGLPIVPELTEPAEVARMVYVLMMTSRESMTVFRLAQACNSTQKLVEEGLVLLQQQLRGLGLPVELTRVGDTVRWMSSAVSFPYLQRLRGVKKLEKLSPAALETLAVIAYRQPVMRSEIEAIRGVKAGPMLRTLLLHKLVKVAGRADVPGRPLQYGTTQQFLERFGLASLVELPSVKEWKNLG